MFCHFLIGLVLEFKIWNPSLFAIGELDPCVVGRLGAETIDNNDGIAGTRDENRISFFFDPIDPV